MAKRLTTLLILAALVAAPPVLQKIVAAIPPLVSGYPLLVASDRRQAPGPFQFSDERGSSLTFADFRGRYVLANVWATRCPPCRKEMPSLDKLKPILERQANISVIAISIDQAGFEQLRAFYKVLGIKNLQLFRGSQADVLSAMGIVGIPATVLLNPQGEEIGRLVGPTKWDDPEVIAGIRGLAHKQ